MAYRKYLSNDTHAGGYGGAFEHIHYFRAAVQGEVTSDQAGVWVFTAPASGSIVSVVGSEMENGGDATGPDALTMVFTVYKNATAVCTTDPAITKAAAADAKVSTAAAGTGITQAVLKTDGSCDFVAGDQINVTFDITRVTPETEITTPAVMVGVKFNAA